MPLPAEMWKAFNRLWTRFKLEPTLGAFHPKLSDVISPITNMDVLLRTTKMQSDAFDLSSAGVVTGFTVPKGKRWLLHKIRISGTTANTASVFALTGTQLAIGINGTTERIEDYYGLPLDELHSVDFLATGNGADNAINMRILYEEEDAF
jgi:hypothetical protein